MLVLASLFFLGGSLSFLDDDSYTLGAWLFVVDVYLNAIYSGRLAVSGAFLSGGRCACNFFINRSAVARCAVSLPP